MHYCVKHGQMCVQPDGHPECVFGQRDQACSEQSTACLTGAALQHQVVIQLLPDSSRLLPLPPLLRLDCHCYCCCYCCQVAVKVVQIASHTELLNFLRELEALANLRHPNVVPFCAAVLEVRDTDVA